MAISCPPLIPMLFCLAVAPSSYQSLLTLSLCSLVAVSSRFYDGPRLLRDDRLLEYSYRLTWARPR